MAAIATSMSVARVAPAKVSFTKARVSKAFGVSKARSSTVMMAKITLNTPGGTSVIDCGDDTYILDAAEVRNHSLPLDGCFRCRWQQSAPRERPDRFLVRDCDSIFYERRVDITAGRKQRNTRRQ
jgi:hypothetical protein